MIDVAGELLRRLSAPVPPPAADRPRAAALDLAMRRSFLAGMVAFQVVMVLAAAERQLHAGASPWLPVGHLATLLLALAALRGPLPGWPTVLACDVMFLCDYAVTESLGTLLVFSACWMRNLSAAAPTFVMRGRQALVQPVITAVIVPVAMLIIRPDLAATLPVSVLVTGLSIITATRIGASFLWDFANAADAQQDAVEHEQRAALVHRRASSTAAEDTRMLHDTVINTLAAIAVGTRPEDVATVRERCAHDVVIMQELQGRAMTERAEGGLLDLPPVAGIRVRRSGADDSALALAETLLTPSHLQALRRCATELVQNAAKHSGADEVEVDVALGMKTLTVTVSDQGVGFDGHLPEGRGLHRSVIQRAEQVGIRVMIDTAPGRGTSIRLEADLHAAAASDEGAARRDGGHSETDIAAMLRRAGFLYAVGLACVGLVLALTNHAGRPNEEYLMVGVISLATLVAWRTTRAHQPLPRPATMLLGVTASAAFVFSALAVGLGSTDPTMWQAIGPTGPLMLLLVLHRTLLPALLTAGGYALTVAVTAIVAAEHSAEASAIVVMAGLVGLGLSGAWAHFMTTMLKIGADAITSRRLAAAARTGRAARDAADRVRERWRRAGLAHSLALVSAVAEGADPSDPSIRSACAEEEAHLRQLLLLNPDLVHLGQWLIHALSAARARGVSLVVRTGETDVDATAAEKWGSTLVQVVEQTSAASVVTASAFPGPDGTRLLLVAPSDAVPSSRLDDFEALQMGDTALLELLVTDAERPLAASR